MTYTADSCIEELDKLLANMNELQINNLIKVLDIYVTLRGLKEMEIRMNSPQNSDMGLELKMRGVVDFRDHVSELLKTH